MGSERSEQVMSWLGTNGFPAYNEPDTAVSAITVRRDYAKKGILAAQMFQPYTDIDFKVLGMNSGYLHDR